MWKLSVVGKTDQGLFLKVWIDEERDERMAFASFRGVFVK